MPTMASKCSGRDAVITDHGDNGTDWACPTPAKNRITRSPPGKLDRCCDGGNNGGGGGMDDRGRLTLASRRPTLCR